MNQAKKLPNGFLRMLKDLETSFLAETDPVRRSGFAAFGGLPISHIAWVSANV